MAPKRFTGDSQILGQLKTIFGDKATNDFIRMSAVFALAAYVHARQVRTEIREQLGVLTAVIRADLAEQQNSLAALGERVTKLESQQKPRGKTK